MSILEIAALVMAAAALFVAWQSTRRAGELTAKLDRLQTTLYESRQEQRSTQQEFENRLAALDVALQQATGKLRFDPETPLIRLFETEPRAQSVLAAFHIGGCADCAVDENHSLAEAVRERGADLNRILTALNTLPADGGAANLRVPNVKFDL